MGFLNVSTCKGYKKVVDSEQGTYIRTN